ncbi:type III-A CRISPR-associated RAMP protein Csm4 [Streptococcus oralis]|uniref:type III-A CRISPR-associated RAMP protein Csm4 n=1 Tax=Streptococcus oralis TaxID=1303 RepID=UPI0018E17A39|nr:type III-A CRISPR-associated RAMP protein Csm4 [Streptococcus oralis]QQC00121.1 type III-A CRISPR-associated RAMP protein Csm4 [Streptococcus oralis]
MTYKMYIMNFHTAHFGAGTLDSSKMTFAADRLFSALAIEAKKMGKMEEFVSLAGQDDFVLTDAFPYQSSPYLPKPIGFPKFEQPDLTTDVKEVRRQAKMAKKLQFIPLDKFDSYVNGTLFKDEEHAVTNIITKNQPHVDGNLFQVSTVRFRDESCLYVIAKESELLNELMTSLQYTGIGGKRSSGYGQFDLTILDLPDSFKNRLTKAHQEPVMTLTTSLPVEKELEYAMETGSYLLSKSSGFAFSTETNENYRKQDLYKFASGSTFSETYTGQIVDVRPLDFPHEVLNYAKPLFFKMEEER